MPSLDFIRDLEDILKSQGIEYLIISLQKGKYNDRVDVFHNIPDLQSVESFDKILVSLRENFAELKKGQKDQEDKSSKKKKK